MQRVPGRTAVWGQTNVQKNTFSCGNYLIRVSGFTGRFPVVQCVCVCVWKGQKGEKRLLNDSTIKREQKNQPSSRGSDTIQVFERLCTVVFSFFSFVNPQQRSRSRLSCSLINGAGGRKPVQRSQQESEPAEAIGDRIIPHIYWGVSPKPGLKVRSHGNGVFKTPAQPWSVTMETDRPLSITEITPHKLCVWSAQTVPKKHPFPQLMVNQDSVYWNLGQGEIFRILRSLCTT